MYDNYFSNFGRPLIHDDICKDSVTRHPRFWRIRFLNVFSPYKCIGQMSMYDHYFSYFGGPPVYDDICKDSATRSNVNLRSLF